MDGVAFTLPENLEVRDEGKSDNIFLAYDPEYKYGIAFGVFKAGADDIVFAADVCEKGLKEFYSLYPSRDIKLTEPISETPLSKHEINGFTAQSFHSRERTIINLRKIEFGGKKFYIGYLLLDSSKNSRDLFEKGLEMKSAPGCDSLTAMITSITGESFDEGSNPCRSNNGRPVSRPAGRPELK